LLILQIYSFGGHTNRIACKTVRLIQNLLFFNFSLAPKIFHCPLGGSS